MRPISTLRIVERAERLEGRPMIVTWYGATAEAAQDMLKRNPRARLQVRHVGLDGVAHWFWARHLDHWAEAFSWTDEDHGITVRTTPTRDELDECGCCGGSGVDAEDGHGCPACDGTGQRR